MEGIFGLLLLGGGGSIAYLMFWLHSRERSRLWREAARAAGLADVQVSTFLGVESKLTGTAGPLTVTIETYRRGKHEHGTRIIVGGLRHGTYALTIRPEGVTSMIEKTFGEREIELGDPAFDDTAYAQGAPELVRAVFDRDTRRLVGALLHGELRVERATGPGTLTKLRASVSDSELRVEFRSSLFDDSQQHLPGALPALLAIGQRLLRPDDLATRIAANIAGEPLAPVRLASLRTLASTFEHHAATRAALVAALTDDSTDVRLHAAIALGPLGRDTLSGLASEQTSDEVSARAIGALGADFPSDRAVTRLRQARGAGHTATALACIDAVGRAGTASAVFALCETLVSGSDVLAAAAARTLGGIGGEAAEPALMSALEHESSEVRVAAAEALGRAGTPIAVVPLHEASASHRLDGSFRRAARQAIAEIQSRVTGASPGQLSLAADQAGQVSLVDEDTRGRLSVAQAAQKRTLAGS